MYNLDGIYRALTHAIAASDALGWKDVRFNFNGGKKAYGEKNG